MPSEVKTYERALKKLSNKDGRTETFSRVVTYAACAGGEFRCSRFLETFCSLWKLKDFDSSESPTLSVCHARFLLPHLV